uniref:Uncharacterized protein n=1 Tax=Marmota marmota marmota TaxID=9994 RepID=A0A8C5Z054_MARMA
ICNSNGSLSSDGAGSTSHIPASHLGENKPLLLRVFKAVVPQEDSLGKGSFQKYLAMGKESTTNLITHPFSLGNDWLCV